MAKRKVATSLSGSLVLALPLISTPRPPYVTQQRRMEEPEVVRRVGTCYTNWWFEA
jgi:hypothetical protein